MVEALIITVTSKCSGRRRLSLPKPASFCQLHVAKEIKLKVAVALQLMPLGKVMQH